MPYADPWEYKRSQRICRWRRKGLKLKEGETYFGIYDKWESAINCEKCNVELCDGQKGGNHRTMDHDHSTGYFRNILCHNCNSHMEDIGVRKDSKTGEKFISLHQGKYRCRKIKHFDKCFPTLDEAIIYRNFKLSV
tara:strand:- start:213 stop:620 length:408 start_codon:yes stop_codon:yes gene_type:complete